MCVVWIRKFFSIFENLVNFCSNVFYLLRYIRFLLSYRNSLSAELRNQRFCDVFLWNNRFFFLHFKLAEYKIEPRVVKKKPVEVVKHKVKKEEPIVPKENVTKSLVSQLST
jgi:hypothetical protein